MKESSNRGAQQYERQRNHGARGYSAIVRRRCLGRLKIKVRSFWAEKDQQPRTTELHAVQQRIKIDRFF
jgi:hypothetical protein